ncbi:hypothetical protein BU17DRAFT_94805 [Hysterangium stoloniferum]|nr:hypothetical protein BU17DRAFT_94805 [Hysterangium stoloniferum]
MEYSPDITSGPESCSGLLLGSGIRQIPTLIPQEPFTPVPCHLFCLHLDVLSCAPEPIEYRPAETLLQEVDWLQLLDSPTVWSAEQRKKIIDASMREIFRMKRRERWSRIERGHGLCYRVPEDDQHVALVRGF